MQVYGLGFAIKQKITAAAVKAVTVILVFQKGKGLWMFQICC